MKSKKILFYFPVALLSITVLFLVVTSSYYLHQFSKTTHKEKGEIISDLWSGFNNPYQKDYLTVLILGLDQREGDDSLLTDTILLATINAKTGNYLLFSVPRDLWLDDLQTKINALYYYGQKQNPDDGTELVKEKLEEILDWKIDYVSLLKMEQIKQLVDLLGGVEVEVERSFVDEEFPKDNGDHEMMTVSFKEGKQVFDGEKALQFMRSRKSKDVIEGTDEARQKRQKKVILALKEKLMSDKSLWKDSEKVAKLYLFLIEQIETKPGLDLEKIASFWRIGKAIILGGKQKEAEVSWKDEEAILVSSRDSVHNAWILSPKNGDWDLISNYFKENLP